MKKVPLLLSICASFTLLACSPPAEYDPPQDPEPDPGEYQPTQQDERADRVDVASTHPNQSANQSNGNAANSGNSDSNRDCELTMGYDIWAPYHYQLPNGEVTGLDVDIAKATLERMECSLTYQQGTWRELLAWIDTGEIDFVMGASQTDMRVESAYFSDPYRQEEFVLYVRANEADRFTEPNLRSFVAEGRRVGVTDGYYYGASTHNFIEDNLEQFPSALVAATNVELLLEGEIDGFLEERAVGAALIAREGLEQDIEPYSEIALDSSDVHVMFSRRAVEREIREEFDEALREIRQSDEYDTIMQRYMQD